MLPPLVRFCQFSSLQMPCALAVADSVASASYLSKQNPILPREQVCCRTGARSRGGESPGKRQLSFIIAAWKSRIPGIEGAVRSSPREPPQQAWQGAGLPPEPTGLQITSSD
ncbi:unnamed protein product [Eretmochelys imbricata]